MLQRSRRGVRTGDVGVLQKLASTMVEPAGQWHMPIRMRRCRASRSRNECNSSHRPILCSEAQHAREFPGVGRHMHRMTQARLGCDQQVIGTDRRPHPLEPGANFGGLLGIFLLEWPRVDVQRGGAETISYRPYSTPNDSKGTGTAEVTYDIISKTLTWTIDFDGLTGPATHAAQGDAGRSC
jgi:hypothetical protein